MTTRELIQCLVECTNFQFRKLSDNHYYGSGAINNFKNLTAESYPAHYDKCSKALEEIPWTFVVKNPRNPQPDEYPASDGRYLTMLDCNEHEVNIQNFRNGSFTLYNKTHIKWILPLPEDFDSVVSAYLSENNLQ